MTNRIIRFVPVALLFALCSSAQAQQPKKIPRIGNLTTSFASEVMGRVDALRQGLREPWLFGRQEYYN